MPSDSCGFLFEPREGYLLERASKYQLIYVDDNPGDQRLLKESVRGRDHLQLAVASSGEELLTLLDQPEELPRLVLLDWNLPGLSGVELLRRIKDDPKLRTTPVIVFTTNLPPDKVSAIYNERANCIVEKPMAFDGFAELIDKIDEFWLRTTILPKGQVSLQAAG